MSEPIYDVNLVAHLLKVDDGTPVDVKLISTSSGPAGESVIELSDSIHVSVDFAQPELLSSISIRAGDSSASEDPLGREVRELLGDLIGEERADELGRVIARRSQKTEQLLSSQVRQQLSSFDRDPSELAIRLGQLASLSSIATSRGEASIVRLIAALEGITIVSTIANDRIQASFESHLESIVGSMIGSGDQITLPEDIEDDLQILKDNHRGLVRRIEMILGRVSTVSTGVLGEVAAYMVSTLRKRAEEPALFSALEYDGLSLKGQSQTFALNVVTTINNTEEPLMVDSAGSGRLELVWPEDPGGPWLRIMHPIDLTLVALVPVRRVADQWIAEAIVPPDRPLNTWLIEVTSMPLGSGSRTAAERIIEAVRLGQAAARMQRGTRQPDSGIRAAWLVCAGAWQELGDEFRANKAREFADGRRVTRRLQVADQVRTALGLDDF